MKRIKQILFFILIVYGFINISCLVEKKNVKFTESDILEYLDLGFQGIPNKDYPKVGAKDIKYNFFMDLEHGYCETAGSRIHLFAENSRWAIVFEKSGYQNRATSGEIELYYFGNCISYNVSKHSERNYISNTSRVLLIEPSEFTRIENKEGNKMETFELISEKINSIRIRDKLIPLNNEIESYMEHGIQVREFENPDSLIAFGDVLRYLHETEPEIIQASEDEFFQHLPSSIPKIMTIDKFHYKTVYEKSNLPSGQETYKLIAKVLVNRDSTLWKPTELLNNSWKNWDSGNL